MCRLICNLPEWRIRIFNPLASYFLIKLGMSLGSKILILNAVEFFAALNNTCISDRTIALLLPCLWICSSKTIVPADFQSAGI